MLAPNSQINKIRTISAVNIMVMFPFPNRNPTNRTLDYRRPEVLPIFCFKAETGGVYSAAVVSAGTAQPGNAAFRN